MLNDDLKEELKLNSEKTKRNQLSIKENKERTEPNKKNKIKS